MSKIVEFSATRLIPVPVRTLWEITGDPCRNSEWTRNVRSVEFRGGPAVVGDTFTERSVVVGPIVTTTAWTLDSVTDLRERTFVGGGFPGVGEVRPYTRFEAFTDEAGREHTNTTYGSRLTFDVGNLSGLYATALASMIRAEFADSLANLEQLALREHRISARS